MGKMGRPKLDIDQEQLEKLMGIHCTEEEIAGWFECSVDTIERRCVEYFGETFAEAYKKFSGRGKCSLRRAQWTAAQNGSITMMIWLGKQMLGQKDMQLVQDTFNAAQVTHGVNGEYQANARELHDRLGEDFRKRAV